MYLFADLLSSLLWTYHCSTFPWYYSLRYPLDSALGQEWLARWVRRATAASDYRRPALPRGYPAPGAVGHSGRRRPSVGEAPGPDPHRAEGACHYGAGTSRHGCRRYSLYRQSIDNLTGPTAGRQTSASSVHPSSGNRPWPQGGDAPGPPPPPPPPLPPPRRRRRRCRRPRSQSRVSVSERRHLYSRGSHVVSVPPTPPLRMRLAGIGSVSWLKVADWEVAHNALMAWVPQLGTCLTATFFRSE